ncbi:hypothetical protein [Caulobacter rhizosphaerae]|jgi:hypothetical protein|uniref:hypothetical protein n=1 Tax=Caulobacter rhizosphaerae TaxID=2010972 RepID=UPI0013D0A8AC|nr:hypothetical protein [Caulobacter rhizosphaerae]GGL08014.1 hypothetical protein GCM10010983_01460 [Caulobacter rhizosphaerae]
MFSEHEVATEVLELMQKIAQELNDSLIRLRDRIPEDEWKAYRLGIGAIRGEMLGEITYHIGERYPDLRRKLYGD